MPELTKDEWDLIHTALHTLLLECEEKGGDLGVTNSGEIKALIKKIDA